MDETYVPGLNREKSSKDYPAAPAASTMPFEPAGAAPAEEEIPVVGFLYSLSRGGEPEWWPLHIGQNKIGKDANMDICLSEASISGHHANINIKRMRRSGNALSASLIDMGSKNGIMLNDDELDYEPHTIHNEDIVTFGLNYKCVIILVDPTKYGLGESEEFVATAPARKNMRQTMEDPMMSPDKTTIPASDPFEGFDDNSTINISGTGIDISGGATKIL